MHGLLPTGVVGGVYRVAFALMFLAIGGVTAIFFVLMSKPRRKDPEVPPPSDEQDGQP